MCVIPPVEGWDEYQHVAYVTHILEVGRPAAYGDDQVPDSLLAAMIPAFPQLPACPGTARFAAGCRGLCDLLVAARRRPRPAAALQSGRGPDPAAALPGAAFVVVLRPGCPAVRGAGGCARFAEFRRGPAAGECAAGRGVGLGRAGGNRARCAHAGLRSWIGLAIATQPLFLMNSARVSSDALGVFLSTVVVALAMRRDDHRVTWRFAAMGVLAGLAILTKATNWYLVPLLTGSWLYTMIRHRTPGPSALASGIAAALGVAMLVGPEIRYNLATYGVPTSMQEAILNHQHGRGLSDLWQVAGVFPWSGWVRWLWLHGGAHQGWVELVGSVRWDQPCLLPGCRGRGARMGVVLGWSRGTASGRPAPGRRSGDAKPWRPARYSTRPGRPSRACCSAPA